MAARPATQTVSTPIKSFRKLPMDGNNTARGVQRDCSYFADAPLPLITLWSARYKSGNVYADTGTTRTQGRSET